MKLTRRGLLGSALAAPALITVPARAPEDVRIGVEGEVRPEAIRSILGAEPEQDSIRGPVAAERAAAGPGVKVAGGAVQYHHGRAVTVGGGGKT